MHVWLALQEAELWLLPSRSRGTDFSKHRNAFCHPAWCQALATGHPLSRLLCDIAPDLQGWQPLSSSRGAKGGKIKPEDP